jgi:hypothetical protein
MNLLAAERSEAATRFEAARARFLAAADRTRYAERTACQA